MNRQYDNYGRDQFNIENLHFPSPVTGQDLFSRGIQLLKQRDYKQAISVLSDAIKIDPLLSETNYYLAIALLNGRKPRKVDEWTIKDIENQLSIAIHKDPKPSKCYALWAIVKHGFYSMNGFIESPPTANQLFSLCGSIQEKDAKEILSHFDDPSNPYWLHLYNKFGKPY